MDAVGLDLGNSGFANVLDHTIFTNVFCLQPGLWYHVLANTK